MTFFKKTFFFAKIVSFLLLISSVFSAASIPLEKLPPKPTGEVIRNGLGNITEEHPNYIYDESGIMYPATKDMFNKLSDSLYKHTNVALALAIVDDIGDYDIREYAIEVARYWGVGGKTNEGVFILVAMKQRKFSTEIGTGAEGYLPDLLVHKKQQEILVPSFKQSRYGLGIVEFAYSIADVVAKEKGTEIGIDTKKFEGSADFGYSVILLGMFIAFVIIIIKSRSRRKGLIGAAGSSGDSSTTFRGGTSFRGGSFGGGFGSYGSGSSRSSRSSSGFGGGGFGGGGSSGSW